MNNSTTSGACKTSEEFISMVVADIIANNAETQAIQIIKCRRHRSYGCSPTCSSKPLLSVNDDFMYPYFHDKNYQEHKKYVHSRYVRLAILHKIQQQYYPTVCKEFMRRTYPFPEGVNDYYIPRGPVMYSTHIRYFEFFKSIFRSSLIVSWSKSCLMRYMRCKELRERVYFQCNGPLSLFVQLFKVLLPDFAITAIQDESKYKYAGAIMVTTVRHPYRQYLARQLCKKETNHTLENAQKITIIDLRGQTTVQANSGDTQYGLCIILYGDANNESCEITQLPFTTAELHMWLAQLKEKEINMLYKK